MLVLNLILWDKSCRGGTEVSVKIVCMDKKGKIKMESGACGLKGGNQRAGER